MSIATSIGVGAYGVSGEEGCLAAERRAQKDGTRKVVLCLPGATGTASGILLDPYGSGRGIMPALAEAGFLALAATPGGTASFGNDTAQSSIATAKSYAQSTLGGKTGKISLYGGSMGALNALNFARANPTLVDRLLLHIPVIDLAYVHDTNALGLATSIETAYGGASGYAANVSAHNPAAHASDFSSFAIDIWYTTDDVVYTPAMISTFASACGATIHSLGTGGHVKNTLSPSSVVSFFSQ